MEDKVVLITGASSGIGAELAKNLANDWTVAISSSNKSRIDRMEKEIREESKSASVLSVVIDVADPESVANGVEAVVKSCGRIDALINCAGIGGGGPTIDVGIEDWNRIIETNLNGTFYVTKAVLKASAMLKNKWGRIINIASTGGKQGVMFASAYSASKHGVVGLTKSLGLELAKTGVTVNAVCPGFVETELAERARTNYAKLWGCSPSEAKTRIENRVPLGRYIEPQELCGLVRYLLSNESGSVLAQAINVCGGLGNY